LYNVIPSKEHKIALLALVLVESGTDSGHARRESRIISHTHPWISFLVDRVSLWFRYLVCGVLRGVCFEW